MSDAPKSIYPDNAALRQDAATERQFLEENIATVAFHLGQPGAKLSVRSDKNALMVDPGEVLKEISRRLTVAPALRCAECDCKNGGSECCWIKGGASVLRAKKDWQNCARR
jgi:hypothetical protein